jgi:hypothetical protein
MEPAGTVPITNAAWATSAPTYLVAGGEDAAVGDPAIDNSSNTLHKLFARSRRLQSAE